MGVPVKNWISILLLACMSLSVQAAEDAKNVPQVSYVPLSPPLVGNYLKGERLKLYKADIALRVGNAQAAAKVQLHEPLIRNQLVLLFAEQTEESLTGVEAKEALRQKALSQVQGVLMAEEGAPLVEDLLFTNLIIQ